MNTWKCSAAALSLLVFGATSALAGPPPYDNSNDTVTCGTILKGVIKPKPVLTLTGAVPSVLAISGTLSGCSSPSNPNLVFPEGKSKFKGTINAPSNNCTALAGVTTSTGTITITWGATDSVSGAGLLNKTSTVTLPSMSSSGAFSVIAGDQHGDFTLGPPNVALTVAGGFRGPGGSGSASSAEVITTESVTTILRACDTAAVPPAIPGKGLKQIAIGVGRVTLQ